MRRGRLDQITLLVTWTQTIWENFSFCHQSPPFPPKTPRFHGWLSLFHKLEGGFSLLHLKGETCMVDTVQLCVRDVPGPYRHMTTDPEAAHVTGMRPAFGTGLWEDRDREFVTILYLPVWNLLLFSLQAWPLEFVLFKRRVKNSYWLSIQNCLACSAQILEKYPHRVNGIMFTKTSHRTFNRISSSVFDREPSGTPW